MNQQQFRVLYRHFLFRMVDLEILSAQAEGDASKLLGQFASLMVSISVPLAIIGLSAAGGRLEGAQRVLFQWTLEHFLITVTMLATGILAVLSWDSTFPDKRDVMALGPLPIRWHALFLARIAGVGLALGLAVVTLHVLCSLTFIPGVSPQPAFAFGGRTIPATSGFVSLLRTFAAYWIVVLAAGTFVFCCVLALQGIAALVLPRPLFLRASSWLQLAAFSGLVCGALLQPSEATPQTLTAAQGGGVAAWQFSWWFLGLFQELKGSPALAVLAQRAWWGLAAAVSLTGVVYALAYFRTMRKIVEEPDILPAAHSLHRLPAFGNAFETAIGQFSVRSLLRSRRHRMILAFYLGLALAATIMLLRIPDARATRASWAAFGAPLLATSILTMLLAVVGARIAFALPLDLKANWIFRITPVEGGAACLKARRRSMIALGVVPVWLGWVVLLFSLWPWQMAAAHAVVLGLLGAVVAEFCLQGFQKIPFTCSYLPGKTNIHVTFMFATLVLLQLLAFCATWERRALQNPKACAGLFAALGLAVYALRRVSADQVRVAEGAIQFEDESATTIQGLGLSDAR